jgi:hypothetical protein
MAAPFSTPTVALPLLKGNLGVDVRDSCRKDRQLYLWHAELLPQSLKKSTPLSLCYHSKNVSSHFLFVPMPQPRGSGAVNLGVVEIQEHKSVPKLTEKRKRKFSFLAGAIVLIALARYWN